MAKGILRHSDNIWHEAGADDLPQGYQYHFDPDQNQAHMYPQGKTNPAATLKWHPSGEIRNIFTDPDHRGKGLATALVNQTKQNYPALSSSDELTADGRAWSKKVFNHNPKPTDYNQGYKDIEGDTGENWEVPQQVQDYLAQPRETDEQMIERMRKEWQEKFGFSHTGAQVFPSFYPREQGEPWLTRENENEPLAPSGEMFVSNPQFVTGRSSGWMEGEPVLKGPTNERQWRQVKYDPNKHHFYHPDTNEPVGQYEWAHGRADGTLHVSRRSKGILRNTDLNVIFRESDLHDGDAGRVPPQALPDHNYLQHHLGDDEDWGVQRIAAVGEPIALHRGFHLHHYTIPRPLRKRMDAAVNGIPDPDLSEDILTHLSDEHRRTNPASSTQGYGQSWSTDPGVAHLFSKGPSNNYRSDIPFGVVLHGQWDGQGQGDDQHLHNIGHGTGLPSEQEKVLLPGTAVSLTGMTLHRHQSRNRGSVDLPVAPRQITADRDLRFTDPYFTPHAGENGAYTVEAHGDGQKLGEVDWDPTDGNIGMIRVHPNYRRQGVGKALYDHVKATHEPHLSMGDNMTPDGRAFSEHLGRLAAPLTPAQPIDMAKQNMTYTGPAPGSSHGAEIHQGAGDTQWLVKKAPPQKSHMVEMDVAANRIASHSGLEAPATFKMNTPEGGTASAQLMYPHAKDAFPGGFEPINLSDDDMLTIQKHHALDWMLSNHDDHKDNFIRTQDGKLVGIDKGQAMKFFNNDRLHWDFHPNEHEPVHNKLYRSMVQGGQQLHDPRQGELGKYIQGLQDIPDHEYQEMLRPYAEGAASQGELAPDWNKQTYWNSGNTKMGPARIPPNDPDAFLNVATQRKNSLMNDFGKLYDKAMAHRNTGTGIA